MKTLSFLLTSILALRTVQAQNGTQGGGSNGNRFLLDENFQDASSKTGQVGDITPGQVESQTDDANFINFCTGKVKTNGLQIRTGSCNGIVMGEIPAADKMISTLILFPNPKSELEESVDFTITLRTDNLKAGFFTNAQATYYSAPQRVDPDLGIIIGHTHVTVQLIDDESGKPPPAALFAFFKGINTPANSDGILSATVAGGLLPGNYRVCSMSSSSNHQPVLMPVAQRGAQDDCQRFTVKPKGQGGQTPAGNDPSSSSSADQPSATGGNGNGGGNGSSSSAVVNPVSVGSTTDPASTATTAASLEDVKTTTTRSRRTRKTRTRQTTTRFTTTARAGGSGGPAGPAGPAQTSKPVQTSRPVQTVRPGRPGRPGRPSRPRPVKTRTKPAATTTTVAPNSTTEVVETPTATIDNPPVFPNDTVSTNTTVVRRYNVPVPKPLYYY